MNDRDYTGFMHAEMDGDISAEDAGRLRERLRDDPEAARQYAELRDVERALVAAEPVSPPPGLRTRILSAIAADRATLRPRRGYFDRLMEALSPSPSVRYAYAFAAGAVIAICAFVVVSVTVPGVVPADPDDLYGALGVGHQSCGWLPEPLEFSARGVFGSADVAYCDSGLTLDLMLSSDVPVEVVIEYGDDVSLKGMGTLRAGSHVLRASSGSIELEHAGVSNYRFQFSRVGRDRPPLSISVTSADGLVFEGDIPPERD
jgi:hypothetical protein